ncbi:MAG: hypothetical protein ABEJ68_08475 [Halobacteriaceae archaeon]
MNRALLLVGCLLCLALPAAAMAGPAAPAALDESPPAATEPTQVLNETPRMLTLGEPTAQGYNATEFDPGVAFSMDGAELDGTFERYRLVADIENASTDAERQRALSTALGRLESRVDALRQRERAAARAYAAGDISERAFLQRLGRIHASATTLKDTADAVLAISRTTGEAEFQRANTVSRAAEALTGPLRRTLAAGLTARAGAETVYTAVTPNGVVLATVEDRTGGVTYVRETVRFDNRDDDGSTTFESASAFYEFMADRYPMATSGPPSLSIAFPGSIHRFDVRHAQGTLTAYTDGSTRAVFREVHTLRVADLPVEASANTTEDGLAVRVNRTFPGGPVEVTVRNRLGDPVSATVHVADRRVGGTGPDGHVWTVAPHGTYTVTATSGEATVNLTVG